MTFGGGQCGVSKMGEVAGWQLIGTREKYFFGFLFWREGDWVVMAGGRVSCVAISLMFSVYCPL